MYLSILPERNSQDWLSEFHMSRNAVIGKILAGNWHRQVLPDTTLTVSQSVDHPFGLKFQDETRKNKPLGQLNFEVIFNYNGSPGDMRIRHVLLYPCRHSGVGERLLRAIVMTALDAGCSRIFVEPGNEGSSYWPRRGALLQKWPEAISGALTDLIKHKKYYNIDWWPPEAMRELARIWDQEDCLGLNKIICRDDLYVEGNLRKHIGRHLLEGEMIGTCIFDLDHPWTQACLKERLGIDVEAERAKRFLVPARTQLRQITHRPHAGAELIVND